MCAARIGSEERDDDTVIVAGDSAAYLSLNKCLIIPPSAQKVAFFFDSNGDPVDPAVHVDASGISPDGSFFYKKFRKKESKTEIWEVEKHILRTLEKNFVNEPKIEHYPFPKLIDTDEVKLLLKMSYCGKTLGVNRRYRSPVFADACSEPKNVKNTIDCIVNNLLLNNIIYSDIHYENMCSNEKGHLHLVDFGAPARLFTPDQSANQSATERKHMCEAFKKHGVWPVEQAKLPESATERERMLAEFKELSSDILLFFES